MPIPEEPKVKKHNDGGKERQHEIWNRKKRKRKEKESIKRERE